MTSGLQGATAAVVREAIETRDPLPGTRGFAGEIDGTLVRDVLGRYPLFVEADESTRRGVDRADWRVDRRQWSDDRTHWNDDRTHWSADPTDLTRPESVPAGHLLADSGREQIWSLPEPDPVFDEERAVTALEDAIESAMDGVETDDLAVAFSGGVDSALLGAALDVPLYVVGFPGSHDVAAARSAADALGRELRVVELDHERLRDALDPVVGAIRRTNAMDVSIALPLYVLAAAVAADGFERVALGQGADELFGGYAKVAKAPSDPRVEASTVRGARDEVLATLPAQLERDVLAVRGGGLEPVCPLLDDRVVERALALSGDMLVSADGVRKRSLRLAARRWLPGEIATRDKKALQYGSFVSRELDRLARQDGFKRRMDDHLGRWIESETSLEG